MAYRYSNFGYDGCTRLGEVPDMCGKCGNVCHTDPEYCDDCLVIVQQDAHEELQMGIHVKLDELEPFINNL